MEQKPYYLCHFLWGQVDVCIPDTQLAPYDKVFSPTNYPDDVYLEVPTRVYESSHNALLILR